MNVDGIAYRSIWINDDGWSIDAIDQTRLPHAFEVRNLQNLEDACIAIRDMVVRGAPLIGATAAYGYYLAMREDSSDAAMKNAYSRLFRTRPTAVNLRWSLDRLRDCLEPLTPGDRFERAFVEAGRIAELDVETNQSIGIHGLEVIKQIAAQKPSGESVNILTHCNAGWLATVDWGTATAPIYMAHDAGIPIHIWVDETRPRNQGAGLTTWELGHHGIPHTLIVDNLGGHLMQQGMVDLCLVGSDRTTRSGDVCNKVGTYLKALAAKDNAVPFYVCLPSTTIDWDISNGAQEVPIEQRDEAEVSQVMGKLPNGEIGHVKIAPDGTKVANYAFDVTPARLITGLITETAIVDPSAGNLAGTFPSTC
ncbi:MAG: S-methyl-5-thioribose-1-phosphate isomerase [Gammaproteobacteria bacterium]|nr:S-methyl-5-thioribose-1-phosphate isomerase [Gammaproteobacteria bacterium]